MLILAGVSLNAIIGDNGIITNAQDAKIKSGMAALEEYLQEKYVEYYDEVDNYENKPELLGSKINNIYLKDGTNNYIVNGGRKYYLINKQALPNEISKGLVAGNTTEWAKYLRLEDVYGVTEDLEVYYCDKSTGEIYGNVLGITIDSTQASKQINNNIGGIRSQVVNSLKEIGIDVTERDITIADVAKLRDLTIDGTKSDNDITSLSALSEIRDLQTLTLSNLNLENLNGLEYLTNLSYIFLDNCSIGDYSKLIYDWNLKYIYMFIPETVSQENANLEVTRLGTGLIGAKNLTKVNYLGISGDRTAFVGGTSDNSISKLSDISGISNFHINLRNSIKFVDFRNNSLTSIKDIENFKNIITLNLGRNAKLENLIGLENHVSLDNLNISDCSKLKKIEELMGCNVITVLEIHGCSSLTSLKGIEGASNLTTIYMWNKNDITDISALSGKANLKTLYLGDCTQLVNVTPLGTLTGLTYLFLNGSDSFDELQIRDALANPTTHIAKNCGKSFYINEKYQKYFLDTVVKVDLSYDTLGVMLEDSSDKITSLKYKTNVKYLNLSGQSKLTNDTLQDILATMTGLRSLSLNGVSQLSSLDFIGEYENEEENVIKKVTSLKELDLRGTAATLTDLSSLNGYSSNLKTLVVDNSSIKFSLINKTIKNVIENAQTAVDGSWISDYSWANGGLLIGGDVSSFSFTGLSGITKFTALSDYVGCSGILDLSGFSDLTTVYVRCAGYKVKIPATVTSVTVLDTSVDLSSSSKLNTLDIQNQSNASPDTIMESINKNVKLQTFSSAGFNFTTLDFLENINTTLLTSISIGDLNNNGRVELTDVSGLNFCSALQSFRLRGCKGLTQISLINLPTNLAKIEIERCVNLADISGLSGCRNCTYLSITNTAITSLNGISSLTGITYLYLNNNKLNNISVLASFKNVGNALFLNDNYITSLEALESMIVYTDDNVNGNLSFNTLNLSNNPVKGTSEDGHNNLKTLEKMKKAGLNTIVIINTNFSEEEILAIKNIFGASNVKIE